jgi:hypothetical protein
MVISMIYLCYIIGYLNISVHFFIISPLSFHAENNLDLEPSSMLHKLPPYNGPRVPTFSSSYEKSSLSGITLITTSFCFLYILEAIST